MCHVNKITHVMNSQMLGSYFLVGQGFEMINISMYEICDIK
jgi:hypothetical protein